MSLYGELKRRNVFRVAAAYVIASWLIVQVVATIATPLNLPDWFETMVLVLLAIGFPIALLLGWVFELTADGIKVSTPDFPTGQGRSHLVDYSLILAILILASVTVWDRMSPGTEPPDVASVPVPVDKSIAVLPFADMSPSGDQEYFGDGIAEEILNELTELDGLRVASRTSSFSFKETNSTTNAIGEALNVNTVLEGSVRMDENRLRVTAQLIDVATGYHHWSEVYDRELDDVFAVQEEIAASVAAVLGVTLGVGDVNSFRGAGTDSFEAYQIYLRALETDNPKREIPLLEQAIALDPDYAAAISALGLAYARDMWNSPVEQAPELLVNADRYLRRAVELSPTSAYGYSLLAAANYASFRFNESEEYFNRALAIEQEGSLLNNYGNMLMRAGKSVAATRYYNFSYDAEKYPFQPALLHLNAHLALEDYVTVLELAEGFPPGPRASAQFLVALNRNDRAQLLELLNTERGALPGFTYLAPVLERQDSAAALTLLREIHSDPSLSWPSKYHDVALVSAVLGDPEFALETFAREVRLTTIRYGALWYPVMREVRQLPGFKELVAEVNLVEYWRTHGWPDHCRPLGSDDFECF